MNPKLQTQLEKATSQLTGDCIEIQDRFNRFIDEHEKEAKDFRNRVLTAEIKIEQLQKDVMRNAIVGGMIGALIGSGAAPALTQIINLIFKLG